MSELVDARYADAGRLVGSALDAFLPVEPVSTADFAAEHRYLANEGGGYVGRWSHEMAPYLYDPMACVDSRHYTTTVVVGPGQCGKTEIAQNWLLKSVATDAADFLWYMQGQDAVEAFVKSRIDTMIEQHVVEMKERQGPRPVDRSLKYKRFLGMAAEFLPATWSTLISKRAPRIVGDEIDAFDPALGDVKALIDVRRQTFGDESMFLALSHPDRALGLDPDTEWLDGIMALYADSDRRIWYWACPHCGGYSSPNPTAARVMTLVYPLDGTLDEVEAEARLLCQICGVLIEDRHRRAMNRTGRWIGRGQTIAENGTVTGDLIRSKTAGFWITGLMAAFNKGIGDLARARVKAERAVAAGGEDKGLRQVIVKQFGLPYKRSQAVGAIDATALADAADHRLALGIVPVGVRFLTAAIDVQGNRFEVLVRGWEPGGRSVIVDYFTIPAMPATVSEDWDKLIETVIERRYPLTGDPVRAMAIRGVGYDSAGESGVTERAGEAWLRWRAGGKIARYGELDGRHLHSVIPTKGASGFDAPRLIVSYPDTQRAGKLAARGAVPLLVFNPRLFKDDLAGQLATPLGGKWSVRFPAALRSEDPPHDFFEQLVSEQKDKAGTWSKQHGGVRNEVLDLMVISHAVARLHGVGKIDWNDPPGWAADWGGNTMIRSAKTEPPAPVPAASPAAAPKPVPAAQPAAAPPKPAPGFSTSEADRMRRLIRGLK
jgi:phage terminase large subunit GpA-like protein